MTGRGHEIHYALGEYDRVQAEIDALTVDDIEAIGSLRPTDDVDRQFAATLGDAIASCHQFTLTNEHKRVAVLALREYAAPWVIEEAHEPETYSALQLRQARWLLQRCRTVLGNMAAENEQRGILALLFTRRWPINHEPLRADAAGLLPEIDRELSRGETD